MSNRTSEQQNIPEWALAKHMQRMNEQLLQSIQEKKNFQEIICQKREENEQKQISEFYEWALTQAQEVLMEVEYHEKKKEKIEEQKMQMQMQFEFVKLLAENNRRDVNSNNMNNHQTHEQKNDTTEEEKQLIENTIHSKISDDDPFGILQQTPLKSNKETTKMNLMNIKKPDQRNSQNIISDLFFKNEREMNNSDSENSDISMITNEEEIQELQVLSIYSDNLQ